MTISPRVHHNGRMGGEADEIIANVRFGGTMIYLGNEHSSVKVSVSSATLEIFGDERLWST